MHQDGWSSSICTFTTKTFKLSTLWYMKRTLLLEGIHVESFIKTTEFSCSIDLREFDREQMDEKWYQLDHDAGSVLLLLSISGTSSSAGSVQDLNDFVNNRDTIIEKYVRLQFSTYEIFIKLFLVPFKFVSWLERCWTSYCKSISSRKLASCRSGWQKRSILCTWTSKCAPSNTYRV